jgi:hypothetical protein
MDGLVSIVQRELDAAKEDPLRLLQLQNNLYGCFLVMEDIGDRILYLTDSHILKGEHLTIDLTRNFSQIGLRYGFAMDARVQLHPVDEAYQQAWIDWFHVIDHTHDAAKVDATEDALNKVLQTSVSADMAFFVHASETGTLSQEWITKLLDVLETERPTTPPSPPPQENALTHAKTESPMIRSASRRLARTRRHVSSANVQLVVSKKGLAKTRRRV